MGEFSTILNNFLFMGLLVFAGFSFVVITQADNNAVQPIGEDSLFNESFNDLQANLDSLESTGNTQYGQFTSEVPAAGFASIVLFGIVSVGKTFGSLTLTTFGLIIKLPLIVLGIPASTAAILFTWLVVSIITAMWLLYKLGG